MPICFKNIVDEGNRKTAGLETTCSIIDTPEVTYEARLWWFLFSGIMRFEWGCIRGEFCSVQEEGSNKWETDNGKLK